MTIPIRSTYRKQSIILLVLLILATIIDNISSYWILKGILWILVIVLTYRIYIKPKQISKLSHIGTVRIWAFNAATVFILTNIIAGFLLGMGKSPYSHSVYGIFTNTLMVGLPLVAREGVRTYWIRSSKRDQRNQVFVISILVMTVIQLSFNQILELNSLEKVVTYMGKILLPLFISNIFVSYLVLYGDSLASIIYLGIIEAVTWYSPILPNLNWLATGTIGILIPAFCWMVIKEKYDQLTKQTKRLEEEKGIVGWIGSVVVSVLIIWFVVGVFPVYPSAVVTGSMKPNIQPGDVVLVERIQDVETINCLKVGDIIQFKRGDLLINHRIIELVEENDRIYYRTKGDNNNVADQELVKPEDIKGSITYVVPKVGLPTIWLKGGEVDLPGI